MEAQDTFKFLRRGYDFIFKWLSFTKEQSLDQLKLFFFFFLSILFEICNVELDVLLFYVQSEHERVAVHRGYSGQFKSDSK